MAIHVESQTPLRSGPFERFAKWMLKRNPSEAELVADKKRAQSEISHQPSILSQSADHTPSMEEVTQISGYFADMWRFVAASMVPPIDQRIEDNPYFVRSSSRFDSEEGQRLFQTPIFRNGNYYWFQYDESSGIIKAWTETPQGPSIAKTMVALEEDGSLSVRETTYANILGQRVPTQFKRTILRAPNRIVKNSVNEQTLPAIKKADRIFSAFTWKKSLEAA